MKYLLLVLLLLSPETLLAKEWKLSIPTANSKGTATEICPPKTVCPLLPKNRYKRDLPNYQRRSEDLKEYQVRSFRNETDVIVHGSRSVEAYPCDREPYRQRGQGGSPTLWYTYRNRSDTR